MQYNPHYHIMTILKTQFLGKTLHPVEKIIRGWFMIEDTYKRPVRPFALLEKQKVFHQKSVS